MPRRVLVTRPEPGASATAEALIGAGFEPVIASLTEIVPLPVDPDIDIGAPAVVAVTSANAVRHAPERLLHRIADMLVLAVGEATAQAATAIGCRNVVSGPGDASGLARLVLGRLPAGSTVLYLCGKLRRPDFETALAAGGVTVSALEIYDTRPVDPGSIIPRAEAAGEPLLAVLLHSAEAAKALAQIIQHPEVAHLFAEAVAVAISDRAAAPLRGAFGTRVRVAAEPTDAAMVSVLRAAR
jgi:uroporphyrinogen-III synthase